MFPWCHSLSVILNCDISHVYIQFYMYIFNMCKFFFTLEKCLLSFISPSAYVITCLLNDHSRIRGYETFFMPNSTEH